MWRGWRCGTCPSRRWRRRGRKTPETHTGRIQTECHVSTERGGKQQRADEPEPLWWWFQTQTRWRLQSDPECQSAHTCRGQRSERQAQCETERLKRTVRIQLSGEPHRKFKSYKLTDDSAASSLWTASPERHKQTRVLSLFSPVLIMITSEHVTSGHLKQNSFTQKADNIF